MPASNLCRARRTRPRGLVIRLRTTASSRRVCPAPRARRPDDTFQARGSGGTSEVYATAAFLPVTVTRRIGTLTAADLFRRVVRRERRIFSLFAGSVVALRGGFGRLLRHVLSMPEAIIRCTRQN